MERSLKFVLTVLCLATFACAQITLDDCPPGVPRDRYLRAWGSSCYHFTIDRARGFPAAESECEAGQGRLVIIRDAATNQFLYNTMKNELHYTGVIFIGLTDQQTHSVWTWVDGTNVTYTNWAPGAPGLLGAFEHCAAMDTRQEGKWDDYLCQDTILLNGEQKFICEYPIVPTTDPSAQTSVVSTNMTTTTPVSSTPCPALLPLRDCVQPLLHDSATPICEACAQITLDACPPGVPRDRYLRAWGSSCYHFTIDHAREFPAAEKECEAGHGHLAIVRDAATNQFLYNTLKNELHYNGVVFIGLTDKGTEHWEWVDGSAASNATYSNWAPGQPGSLGTFKKCATLNTQDGGKWHDYRCEDLLFINADRRFICEYPITFTTPSTPVTTTTVPTTTTPVVPTTVTATTSVPSTPCPDLLPWRECVLLNDSATPICTHSHLAHKFCAGFCGFSDNCDDI